MSNSLGLLLHPFNLSRLCRVIWYQQGRMHLRPRFAEVSQFQDSKSKFQIQVRAETQSMGKNTKMSHTHKTCPCNDMKGLNKMPHETCWLYDFFVPSQFISICSICGNISSLRFHPHGMERNARKDGTSSNPPCFWQNVAKRSENQAAQKCSISYCVRHVKRVLLRRKKVGFEVLLFFFFNGKGGEKNTTTQTWSIIKKRWHSLDMPSCRAQWRWHLFVIPYI